MTRTILFLVYSTLLTSVLAFAPRRWGAPRRANYTKHHATTVTLSSGITLPFSSDVAYEAFSEVRRQPEWSDWLHSVEELDQGESKWTLRYMGFQFSWKAVHTTLDRPNLIEWKSTSGLRNKGKVEFRPSECGTKTDMTMSIEFIAPRIVARFFGERVNKIVEQRILGKTLDNFRDVVLTKDLAAVV